MCVPGTISIIFLLLVNGVMVLPVYCFVPSGSRFVDRVAPNNFRLVPEGILHPTITDKVLERLPPEEGDTAQLTSTKAGGDLLDHYNESLGLSPLERMAMTCYGNLGVILSSFYLKPVEVVVDLLEEVPAAAWEGGSDAASPVAVWDRAVTITMDGCTCCEARCKVRVYDKELNQHFTDEGDFSVGNLLRYKSLQPNTRLHEAGRLDHGGLWRFYSMDCPGLVEFDILEEFSQGDLCSLV